MDVQGSRIAKPYVESARGEYAALVDSENLLADLIGFKIVPNPFLIDESGRFVGRASSRGEVEAWAEESSEPHPPASNVQKPADEQRIPAFETLVRWSPNDANLWLQLAYAYRSAERYEEAETSYRTALSLRETLPAAHFRYGGFLLARRREADALSHLRRALELDPQNYVIRKQIWAVEHPERFYQGAIDWDWQREQMKRESR